MSRPTTELAHLFRQLKAPAAARALPKLADRARAEEWSYEQFAAALLKTETDSRDSHGGQSRIKAARFPARKTLEEFDFAARPSLNKPLALELMKGDWIDQRENLLLVGPSGTGKTHVAIALAMAACLAGRKVRFFRVTELITSLLEARDEKSLLGLRRQLAKQAVIVLDELGYVPASKAGAELLFDVVGQAYERQSLVVTTNLPFENWPEVLGSERLTGAALDRLTHRCHILEFTGESYRLQDARRRRRSKNKE
jgi:DNA replication protein DnaC